MHEGVEGSAPATKGVVWLQVGHTHNLLDDTRHIRVDVSQRTTYTVKSVGGQQHEMSYHFRALKRYVCASKYNLAR